MSRKYIYTARTKRTIIALFSGKNIFFYIPFTIQQHKKREYGGTRRVSPYDVYSVALDYVLVNGGYYVVAIV